MSPRERAYPGDKPSRFTEHKFVDTRYGLAGKSLTLGALEEICAAARAGGASSGAPVAMTAATPFASATLRITWST